MYRLVMDILMMPAKDPIQSNLEVTQYYMQTGLGSDIQPDRTDWLLVDLPESKADQLPVVN
jgi:hypothetical protein